VRKLSKILIFRQSSLGDVILTLPVVKALKENYPDSQIDFITKTPYAPLLKHNPGINNVIEFTNNDSFKTVLHEIKKTGYDFFVDLQANFRSMAIKLALFPTKSGKYKKRRLAREMIVRKPRLKNLRVDHTINSYFTAVQKLQIDYKPEPPEVVIPDNINNSIGDKLSELFPNNNKLIAICPGAKHFEKKWPTDQYAEVANKFLGQNCNIVVISTSADDLPSDLEISDPNLKAFQDAEIIEVAAILKNCDVAITNDSGLMHLSCGVGTPVVAIFGPTHPRLGFSPSLDGSRIITNNFQCSPCSVHGQQPCYQPKKYCFETITPDIIIDALNDMI